MRLAVALVELDEIGTPGDLTLFASHPPHVVNSQHLQISTSQ